MPSRDDAYLRHQQKLWLRPDGDRWVRPDAARFLAPGADVVAAYPALARKYSASQPRVPAGNTDGGQWTDGSNGARPRVIIDTTDLGNDATGDAGSGDSGFDFSRLLESIDFGDIAGEIDKLDLFGLKPRPREAGGVRLAGDLPEGDSPQVPTDEPPKIPKERPKKSAQRTKILRAASSWLARNGGLAGEVFAGALRVVDWLQDYRDVIQANRDLPKTFDELQSGVGLRRPGYDDHHIVEQTWAERWGLSRQEIDNPSNVVSIPRLKHYQITGWYATKGDRFGGLSPREYLADKSPDEGRRIGLDALIDFEVLKP